VTAAPSGLASLAAATGASRRLRDRRPPAALRPWLLLAPALLVVVVLFLGGFAFGVAQSLGYLPFLQSEALSLDAYRELFRDPAVRASFGLTFRIALLSTAVSAVLAVAVGLLIRGTRRGRRLATLLFQLNLPVPHVVGATAMLLLLGQSGLVSRVSTAVGLTEGTAEFPALTGDAFGWGIIAEYVWKETPFIGVVVLAALTTGIAPYEEVARTLGAGAWQRFRHVTLPLLTPAVVSTSVIVFAFSFGSYEVPYLLGRPFPSTLPVVAYESYRSTDLTQRAPAMAVAVVIAVLIGLLVLVYMRLSERFLRAAR
jgi:putative spermidine/putrescine transport system permease protein